MGIRAMSAGHWVWMVVGLVVLFGVAQSATAQTTSAWKECAFVPAGWLPGTAPEGVPKKYETIAAVPSGWTVVGGTMGTAPAMFVCR
jgi:uncharacterized protein YbdZ (MbtH family)